MRRWSPIRSHRQDGSSPPAASSGMTRVWRRISTHARSTPRASGRLALPSRSTCCPSPSIDEGHRRDDHQACYTFACVYAEFVGIALAIQRSPVVMRSTGGQRKRAVVIGGSIGGLFAGLLLRKVGWDVSIHERAGEELASRGAGIATHDELHEAFALATEQDGEIGVSVEGRVVLARSGDVICEVARPQVLASWDRIWKRLRVGVGDVYRHGSALVSVEQDEQCALCAFRRRQRSCCRSSSRCRRHPVHGAASIDA